MIVPGFSVDHRGSWSARQARAVLEIIEPEAAACGLGFNMFDISTFNRPKRVMLQVVCLKHRRPVDEGAACEGCLVDG